MRKSNYLWLLLVAVLLLPAQEMAAKKKKEKEVTDRELWAGVLYQMAAPVLSNMSEGKLQENMQVELSPTWDGRDKRVTYMECFGRLMAGLAPWLSLPDDDTAEGKQRRQLREWALKTQKVRIAYFGGKRGSRWSMPLMLLKASCEDTMLCGCLWIV